MGLAAAFAFVTEQLFLLGHRALTIDTNGRNIGRFAKYCSVGLGLETVDQVTPEVVRAFVRAPSARNTPPSVATMHGRRTAVRLAFRILIQFGLHPSDPNPPGRSASPFGATGPSGHRGRTRPGPLVIAGHAYRDTTTDDRGPGGGIGGVQRNPLGGHYRCRP